jgi:hypothetical protein
MVVSKGKTFDKKLSYFGKCLDFVVMLVSSIHEDLIINIIVATVDEIPPFIECLDNFLQNVDTDETGENVLFVLLADAVQKSCLQESLQPENLLTDLKHSRHFPAIWLIKLHSLALTQLVIQKCRTLLVPK